MVRPIALVALAIAGGACRDAAAPTRTTVVDSAGIRVVTNRPGSIETAEVWTLSPEPVVEIGSGPDPEVALFRIAAVAPLADSRVVISMTAPPQVVVVGPGGTIEATLGRGGEGPGEFAGAGSVVPLGSDSLAVWDPERRRISVFTRDGRFQREVDLAGLAPLSWIAAPSTSVRSASTHLLPSAPGSLVLFSVGVMGPTSGSGVIRVRAPSYRISTGGSELASLGEFPGETSFVSEVLGGAPYPLGADTYGATSLDDLIVGTAESPEFRRYSGLGELERIVRWPDRDRTVGGSLLASWSEFLDAWLQSLPDEERVGIQEILDAMPRPERLPAYGGLVSDDDGRIWIGAYHPGQLSLVVAYIGRLRVPVRQWMVFDVSGTLIATAETPAGFRPYAIRDGRVWGVFTDDLDVESVRAYDVAKP